jgi:SlyX protein
MTDEMMEERFMRLETKIAYQEKLIADLNEVLLERGAQVDLLTVQMKGLQRQVLEAGSEQPANEVPPHY